MRAALTFFYRVNLLPRENYQKMDRDELLVALEQQEEEIDALKKMLMPKPKLKIFVVDLESFCVEAENEAAAEIKAAKLIDDDLVRIRVENITEEEE